MGATKQQQQQSDCFLYKMADNLGPLSHARSTHYTEWQPTAELMQPLLEMGVSENAAKRVRKLCVII